MLTTQPHLRIRRPSPTTVEYIVSTFPDLTLSLRLVLLLTHALRILIGFTDLLLIYSRYIAGPPTPNLSNADLISATSLEHVLYYVLQLRPFKNLSALSAHLPTPAFLPILLLSLYLALLRPSTTESLLVLRGLGIQTSSSAPTYLSTATKRFIPTSKIQDIFINEAFKGFEVRYYLTIVVDGEEDVVVVFERLLPRLKILERVWRGARACLYDGEKEKIKGHEINLT
ncbi:putative GPI-15 component of glycosylphosphatidylinositol-N-acetylglucosaminyl (GPI-GlcNAc) transferase complex [Bisporella sp. PMI_857]|nr:putative GPI-15 component of glycosylphosphatidylinositol-N-acetylglucosaminyl (GPI-GlcNAc) transferase complex [Bisporella sp. PMI_857]